MLEFHAAIVFCALLVATFCLGVQYHKNELRRLKNDETHD
jgi:hypothetical protein